MKILMINDYSKGGGAEVYIKDVTKLLIKKGHKIFHFFVDKNTSRHPNILVYYFRHNYFYNDLYRKLRDYVQKIRPDVIHIHNNYLYTNSVLLACKGSKLVQKVCDYGIICPIGWGVKKMNYSLCDCKKGVKCGLHCLPFFRNILSFSIPDIIRDRIIKKNVNVFISPSIALKRILSDNCFRNVVYLPNFKILQKQKIKRGGEKNIILFAGNLYEQKGAKYLLYAMEKVSEEVPNSKLIIAGDGPEKQELIGIVDKLNLRNKVYFKGKLNFKQLNKLYQDSLMFVIPSIWRENSPHVVYEAMSFGLPVVGFNIGGISELVKNSKNGFIVERFDVNLLSKRIIELIKNRELSKKMGEYGMKKVLDKFNSDKHLNGLEKIYKNIILDIP